jgi:hypothetical protein
MEWLTSFAKYLSDCGSDGVLVRCLRVTCHGGLALSPYSYIQSPLNEFKLRPDLSGLRLQRPQLLLKLAKPRLQSIPYSLKICMYHVHTTVHYDTYVKLSIHVRTIILGALRLRLRAGLRREERSNGEFFAAGINACSTQFAQILFPVCADTFPEKRRRFCLTKRRTNSIVVQSDTCG